MASGKDLHSASLADGGLKVELVRRRQRSDRAALVPASDNFPVIGPTDQGNETSDAAATVEGVF